MRRTTRNAPGRSRGLVLVLVAAATVVGCSSGSRVATAAPAVTAQPAEAPHTVSGSGTANSAPMTLLGGDYAIDVTAKADNEVGCFVGGWLDLPSGKHGPDLGSTETNNSSPLTTTAYAYGLEPGTYHVEMDAGCPWTVTVRRP